MDIEVEPSQSDADKLQAQQLNDAAMGILKEHQGVTATAITMLRRALALCPETPEILGNMGLVYWRMGDFVAAEAALRRCVSIRPESATFQGNLGVFLSSTDRPIEAEERLKAAHHLNEDDCASLWDLCLLQLREGDWKRGLAGYDIRRKHRGPKLYPNLPSPLWRGEDLTGKTIFVQAEQGIGDRFLFSRYLPWLKATWPGCRILCCFHDSMTNLFWEFRHIVEFLPSGVPWPEGVDYAVFLCTLPELHGTTLSNIPPDPGFLRQRILKAQEDTKVNLPQPKRPSFKVGICWTGNPTQIRNFDRSIPLELMLPLAEDPRVIIYSFQCSPGNEDVARCCVEDVICDLSPDLEREGWVGTGMALMEMDLLISVCTSVPHLAGAIGVPTWTLLCADPYWIWGRHKDSTPWYPGMRLFRQRTSGDWLPVITEVRDELTRLVDQRFSLT